MRVESARYVGEDNKGQKFVIVADRAVQPSSDVPVVDITGMFARLNLQQGPLLVAANQGRYNLDTQKVNVDGPVKVVGGDGYRLATRDVTVDLKRRHLASDGPVAGSMRLGEFQAGQLQADLGTRTVVLDHGARLKIVQGAVR
jgi:lipopolysaccharide export system protein LptC